MDFNTTTSLNSINTNHITTPSTSATPITESLSSTTTENTDSILATILTDSSTTATSTLQLLILTGILTKEQLTIIPSPLLGNILPIVYLIINGKYQLLESLLQLNIIDRTITYFLYPPTSSTSLTLSTSLLQTNPISTSSTTLPPSTTSPLIIATSDLLLSTEQSFLESYLHAYQFACQSNNGDSNNNINNNYTNNNNNTNHIDQHHYKTIYQLACYAPLHLFIPTIHILYNYGYNIHQHTSQNLTLLQTLVLALFQPRLNNGDEHLQLISMLIQFHISYCDIKLLKSSPSLYELALASGSVEICHDISSRLYIIDITDTLPQFSYLLFPKSIQLIDRFMNLHCNQYLSTSMTQVEFETTKSSTKSIIIVDLLSALSELLSEVEQLIQSNNYSQIHSTTILSFQTILLQQLSYIHTTYFHSIINPLECRLSSNETILHPIMKYIDSDPFSTIRTFIHSQFKNEQVSKAVKCAFLYARPTNGASILDIIIKSDDDSQRNLVVQLYILYTTDLAIDFESSPHHSTLLHHIAALSSTSAARILLASVLQSTQFKSLTYEQQGKYLGHQDHNGDTVIELVIKSSNEKLFSMLWPHVHSLIQYHSTIFTTIASSITNQDDVFSFIQIIINSFQLRALQPITQSQLLHTPNFNGQTIFDIFIQTKQYTLFTELVSLSTDSLSSSIFNQPSTHTPLHSLAQCQDHEFILQFISNQVITGPKQTISPLSYAITNKNANNQSPINIATQHQNLLFIQLLLFLFDASSYTTMESTILHTALQFSSSFKNKESTLQLFFTSLFSSKQFNSISQRQKIEFLCHLNTQNQNALQIAAGINNFNFISLVIQHFILSTPFNQLNPLFQPMFQTIYNLLIQHYLNTSPNSQLLKSFSQCFYQILQYYETNPQLLISHLDHQALDQTLNNVVTAYKHSIHRQDFKIFNQLHTILKSINSKPIDIDELLLSINMSTFATTETFTNHEIELISNIFTLSQWPQSLFKKYPILLNYSPTRRQKGIMALRITNPHGHQINNIITKFIHISIQSKSYKLLKLLLASHLVTEQHSFQTFIPMVAVSNDKEILQTFHNAGYLDLRSKMKSLENITPFHYITKHQKMQLFNYLTSRFDLIGIGPFSTSIQSPLHIGQRQHAHNLPGYSFYHLILQLPIEQQRYALLQFSQYGAIQSRLNQKIDSTLYTINSPDFNIYSSMFMACAQGNIKVVEMYVDIISPEELFDISKHDETILMAIACSGYTYLFTYIIDLMKKFKRQNPKHAFDAKFFDINYQSKVGHNVLSLAVSYNHIRLIDYLYSMYEPNWKYKSKTTGINLLHCATFTKSNSLECIEFVYSMVKDYFNIDSMDNDGNTPLFTAVMNNNNIAYDFLITHQANPSFIRQDGRNLFHAYAIYYANQSTIDDLYDLIEFIQNGVQDYQFRSKVFFSIPNSSVYKPDISGLTPNSLCYIQTISNSIKKQHDDLFFYTNNNITLSLPKTFNFHVQLQDWLSKHALLNTSQQFYQLIQLILHHNIDPTLYDQNGYNIIALSLHHKRIDIGRLIWNYYSQNDQLRLKLLQLPQQQFKPYESLFTLILDNQPIDLSTIEFFVHLIQFALFKLHYLQVFYLMYKFCIIQLNSRSMNLYSGTFLCLCMIVVTIVISFISNLKQ